FKKVSKAQQFEEDDFVEDSFEDDVDAAQEFTPSSSTSSSSSPHSSDRATRYAKFLAVAQKTLRQPDHHLATHIPSQRILVNLAQQSSVEDLPETLDVLAKWRARGLGPVGEKATTFLLKRLAQRAEEDGGVKAVEVISDRTKYGVDVPEDLKALYPLFQRLSRPQTAPEPAAAVTEPAEGEETAAAAPSETPSSSPAPASSSNVDLIFSLYNTALLHHPTSASRDPLLLLSTLTAAARAGKLSSPRVSALVSATQKTGEDALVEQTRQMGKKGRDLVRMRSRVVAQKMREEKHLEVEWFAHLAESLHGVAAAK
ncbi:hypothetical protein JCM8547_002153, partial [Rhodosporidiobolus lusitaniae]